MSSIWEFPLERFNYSCNLLLTLSKPSMFSQWCNEEEKPDVKSYMYRGAFVDCIEYLYGFIPEVFREFCKRYSVPVYSKDGMYARTLDFVESVYCKKLISPSCRNFIRDLVKIRGKLIHNTLISREIYFDMLNQLIERLSSFNLKELVDCVLNMCRRISKPSTEQKELVLLKWKIKSGGTEETPSKVIGDNSKIPPSKVFAWGVSLSKNKNKNNKKKRKKFIDRVKVGLCGFMALLMILGLFQQLYFLFI